MNKNRTCADCQAPLSRYNSSRRCAACAKKQEPAHRAPSWLWDSEPLRHRLAENNLGAALALIRSTMELSQLELATILGWSQSAVARVESGQRDTLYDIRRLLEVADALDMPRTALIPLITGRADGTARQGNETSEMTINRRDVTGALLGIAAGAGVGQLLVPAKVDSAHIRYFHAAVDKLYIVDQSVGGGSLVHDGLRLFHRARRMLDEADYSESTARHLMRATGEIAVCVGWLCYDANHQEMARALFSEAQLLADQSGDSRLAIRAMEKMALQMTRQAQRDQRPGLARQAVNLSRQASDLARKISCPRLHALLAAREAVAHSITGDVTSFEQAISRAWREMDQEPRGDLPTWLKFVNRSEISIHEARGRWNLGDPSWAVELYRSSLQADLSLRNEANYRAALATALVASGDVTGGVAEGMAALPAISGQINSPRTISRLQSVRRAAARRHGCEDFCEQYDRIAGADTHESR